MKAELNSLHMKINSVDDLNRKNNLLIHGVPGLHKEDTSTLVKKMLTFLDLSNCEAHIIQVSRMRSTDTSKEISPIIVKCDSQIMKTKFVDAFKIKKLNLEEEYYRQMCLVNLLHLTLEVLLSLTTYL